MFWETTRACLLVCRHCRADAQTVAGPGELTHAEALEFVDSLVDFGHPPPILVVTGGDALMRPGLDDVIGRARAAGVPVALAPSVTSLLTDERMAELYELGVRVTSISLDGATAATHEGIRGVSGHFARTIDAIERLRRHGFVVQVNTAVMRENVTELPAVARIVRETGASIWEVFFLVRVGRGSGMTELDPGENEDVCQFLYDASRYGFVVRTVECPMFRRVVVWREEGRPFTPGPLYRTLASSLERSLGRPSRASRAHTKGTRDGKGIVFVSATGEITPAGFLPVALGNVRTSRLADVYREHPLLRDIRAARFSGRCGECEYRQLCGGSRARAFAASGNPLAADPACAYVPAAS